MRSWLACLFLMPVICLADERILEYHSDILVRASGELQVTETIRVRAEGRQIRRGIYRDFPTEYKDRFGNDYSVRYEPLSVLRNERPEELRSERFSNGQRTYFGSADHLLETGEHTYTYRYTVGRVLGYFADKDELYWNVTGHGWAFPIDRASANVTFAFGVPDTDLDTYAYTGDFGAAGDDYASRTESSGNVTFSTTRALGPQQGLTIAVGWPKGLVAQPDTQQKVVWVLSDNLNLLIVLAGLIAMLAYYVLAWRSFGKDPEPGVIMTRYEPPQGYSPASLRYIEKMYYDDTMLTAAVVSLAVKGYLRILEEDDEHSLLRVDPGPNPTPLATGEQELHDALFAANDVVILDNQYHARIGGAREAHRQSLQRDYRNRYFKINGLLTLPAIVVGGVATLIALNVASGPTPFVIATVAAMIIVVVVFVLLMRRPTVMGRNLLDASAGFREYLDIAEKEEMNLRNPPEKTPQLFEAYLPFALALGVEQNWAERFSAVFARLSGSGRADYQPTWYNGTWNNFDMGRTTANISDSLGSAISSSANAPGSSSGSGGGGSSGGGGGGGGGGGW